MTKLASNFYKLWLPMHLLAVVCLWWVADYWVELLAFWFVFGIVGNGVAGHRFFAHGQFAVSSPLRWLLSILTSLGGTGSSGHWVIQHKLHHAYTDTEYDPHTPNKGFWYAMYGWHMLNEITSSFYLQHKFVKKMAIQHARDPFYKFFNNYHYHIIYIFCGLLALIDPVLVLVYALAYAIDNARLGLVNYFCHRRGYRIFDTKDTSTNNLWLGWLGFGMGWHNTHHAHPGQLVLTVNWWEIDIEGYVGWLLSKTARIDKTKHS